ncbi:MAG: isoprenylcysteine carboxylmethyltransferase family protein [Armatimonadetes bacterium]|nr:isoprenylcysteine carboxylmethyltransferase family protein [Armatimonadota bacterium]
MSLVDLLYAVTTGPERRRALLTPVVLVVAVALLLLVVFGSLYMDRALGLPRLLPGALGTAIGVPLLAAGLVLHAWCLVLFWRARGTGGIGVPVNPPRELVTVGPYAWTRNPMLTAAFAWLSGLGFLLNSISMVFVWTPVFVIVNVIELRFVEEPELERRLGASYSEYQQRVPMFIPKAPRVGRHVA